MMKRAQNLYLCGPFKVKAYVDDLPIIDESESVNWVKLSI